MYDFNIQTVTGTDIKPYIKELAALRIKIFSEYPYIYDGSLEYEEKYLKVYTETKESIVVIVSNEDQIVGASTGLPMEFAADEFKEPFIKKGYSPDRIFYFGESVLLKEFRGHGIYPRMFQEREEHAKKTGNFDYTSFCAVERPENHPDKPSGYTPLDRYWRKRGYIRQHDIIAQFSWKDLGEDTESFKYMVFWMKSIK
ncbi:MAG: GNAT family N-acetyltransferase [Desulfamplus sp.]|nr:GNAT family N-acetyltransferase [Desulfamplus sp.]